MRLPDRLKPHTFKEKIFEIENDLYRDPYNSTDKIVFLVRKIIKTEIKNLSKAMNKARQEGQKGLAANYGLQIWLLIWLLDNKFDFKKKKK